MLDAISKLLCMNRLLETMQIKRNIKPLSLIAMLFVLFFLLYQLSFALQSTKFPLTWCFGADSMEEVYKGTSKTIASHKHPLFSLLTTPLYNIGSIIYSKIPESHMANMTLAFPVALFGAANVCLSFIIFMKNYPSQRIALLFSLLYGVSATTWVFSSFPETYVITAFFTNIFLLTLICQSNSSSSIALVSVTNALACYASPQQIFLAIIPCISYLITGNWSKQAFGSVAKYLFVLVILFLIPYEVYIKCVGSGWKLAPVYLSVYGEIQRFFVQEWYAVVLMNFLLFSVVGPSVHPSLFTDPSLAVIGEVSCLWIFAAVFYIILVVRSLVSLKKSSAKLKILYPGIMFFVVFYLSFFIYFFPKESFIYTLPSLLPWYLLIHSGYTAFYSWKWQVCLALFILIIIINNSKLIVLLNGLF